jgi:hypothetical protein
LTVMKVWQLAALLSAGACGAITAAGQTKVDLGDQSKDVDFSQASSVRPFPTGLVLPAACSVGQMFYLTGSPVPVQECVAPNVWSPVTGLSGNAILNVQWISRSQLTIGSECAVATPCIYRIGSSLYSVTAPATATLNSANSGLAYIYIDTNGNIVVGVSSSSVVCSGCLVVTGTTQYPIGCIPLETWNATNGVWDPAGTNDIALLSTPPTLNAGANVTITQTGPAVTIAASGSSGSGSSGSGSSGSGGPTGAFYNPTDPTQWFRDHITLATGFNNGQDGWSYTGNCNAGSGSGATGFSSESVLSTTWLSVTGAGAGCFYIFPTVANGAYGNATFDYWSGETPAELYVAAVYRTTDTNGTHYVGLGSGSDFIGCRQIGSGNWFAVITQGGVDLAKADTGVPHDTNTHRVVVDNASGTANAIRCSVDGSNPAVASAAVPAENFGWNYEFGAVSAGSTANFAPCQYTISLQGLPRL